mmetsp:Transcript_4889/g.11640  ORF Transcript_4889/g.11640 Transcript_4889/m.11640 type:complete len:283 (-) Transcript_4889:1889-2737(-)
MERPRDVRGRLWDRPGGPAPQHGRRQHRAGGGRPGRSVQHPLHPRGARHGAGREHRRRSDHRPDRSRPLHGRPRREAAVRHPGRRPECREHPDVHRVRPARLSPVQSHIHLCRPGRHGAVPIVRPDYPQRRRDGHTVGAVHAPRAGSAVSGRPEHRRRLRPSVRHRHPAGRPGVRPGHGHPEGGHQCRRVRRRPSAGGGIPGRHAVHLLLWHLLRRGVGGTDNERGGEAGHRRDGPAQLGLCRCYRRIRHRSELRAGLSAREGLPGNVDAQCRRRHQRDGCV